MKLLLTSASFTNEEIFQACEKLVGKKRRNIKIVTIEEAHKVETGDMTWFNEEKQVLLNNFKSVTELHLQSQPLATSKKLINDADMIYCFGGNASYLTKVLEDTGFADILPELLEQKVWVGSSAGSCVLCHKESDHMSQEIFQEPAYVDHYLNLLPMIILPHYQGFFNYDEADIKYEVESSHYPVYVLSDQAALEITGRPNNITITPVGENYHIDLGKDFDEAVSQIVDKTTQALDTTAKAIDDISTTIKNLFK